MALLGSETGGTSVYDVGNDLIDFDFGWALLESETGCTSVYDFSNDLIDFYLWLGIIRE